MLFNSIEFLIFLPLVFFGYWFVFKSLRWQNLFVVAVSYLFYGWWDWRFLLLILFTSLCSYLSGVYLEKCAGNRSVQKWISAGNILLNLSILGVFKYFDFFTENLVNVLHLLGWDADYVTLNILLPVGISFYTFQALSYTIDVYQGKIKATHDIVAFFAYISFFPQLVAGPIERATHLLPQFLRPRNFDCDLALDGIRQMLWGFFKKVVVADNCALFVNGVFENYQTLDGSTLFLGAFFFTIQIYGDFSGYSDIAIGCARLFGIDLMQNFKYPYFSRDIAEFWRRWHISLSSWLRDYVYIPLGGNRRGRIAKFINLTVVFAVSGVWHGTGWKFLVWGLLHAFYQIAGELTAPLKKRMYTLLRLPEDSFARRLLQTLGTFLWVMLAWIIFRAESLESALMMIRSMFTVYNPWTLFDGSLFTLGLEGKEFFILLLSVMTLWGVETWQEKRCIRDWILEQHLIVRWGIYLAGICLIWIYGTYGFGFGQDFIYGRF